MSKTNLKTAPTPTEIQDWIDDTANWRVKGTGIRIGTASGVMFRPCDAANDDVVIDDIARGLSAQSRFNGQINPMDNSIAFYSVAQHSVVLSYIVEDDLGPEMARVALMHDAAEAYLGDIIQPVKVMIPEFDALERMVQAKVFDKLDLDPRLLEDPVLCELDSRIAASESIDLQPLISDADRRANFREPLGDLPAGTTRGMGPRRAYNGFVARFQELFPERQEIFSY